MSDIIRIDELEDAEPLSSGDFKVIFQPSSGGDRREKKQDALIQNPRSFTSGRLDSKELISGVLTVTGWHTFAETDDDLNTVQSCDFTCIARGSARISSISGKVSTAQSNLSKTFENTTVEITKRANQSATNGVPRFRLAKSDSVNGAGFKIQVYLDISTDIIISTLLKNNTAYDRSVVPTGFQLVTPYLDNTPTLPDGVTVGTFLEAGEEFSFDNAGVIVSYPDIIGYKNSNDQIRCIVNWSEIPKQGSNIVLSLPTTLRFIDGSGAVGTVTVAHTISNFSIDGKHILFIINEVGVATSLNIGPLAFNINGSGCKLTIT